MARYQRMYSKEKQMKPRNPMGIHVHKRKAGRHCKTMKAIRRKEKVATMRDCNSTAEYPAFNRSMRVRFSPVQRFTQR